MYLYLNVGHGGVGLAEAVPLLHQLLLPEHELGILFEEPAQLRVVVYKLVALL